MTAPFQGSESSVDCLLRRFLSIFVATYSVEIDDNFLRRVA